MLTVDKQVTLVINGPPPVSLNVQERLHWATRQRLRDWWAEQSFRSWLQAGRPTFKRPAVQYRVFYATNRRRDADNVVASCKPILDGLKGNAFTDDHSGVVTILPPIIGVDKQRPRVEIVIRETQVAKQLGAEG